MTSTHAAFQCVKKLPGIDGLGQMIVHARCEACFPISFHGVRRHGDDWQRPVLLLGTYTTARFKAIHDWHAQVHQNDIVRNADLLQALQGFQAVFHHIRLGATSSRMARVTS